VLHHHVTAASGISVAAPIAGRNACAICGAASRTALECHMQLDARMRSAASVPAGTAPHAVVDPPYGGSSIRPDPAITRVLVVDDNAVWIRLDDAA
jgi:hypothetical protein